MTARSILRHRTRDDHDRVDALFSPLSLSERGDYRRFLCAQAAAFLPCEAALDSSDAARIVTDWPARRRAPYLRDDLAALGADIPQMTPAPAFENQAAMLGAIYVLEGSRLGGAMLARSVPDTLPKSFLTRGAPDAWRSLTQMLDEKLRTALEIDYAVKAAKQVFGLFERGALLVLQVE